MNPPLDMEKYDFLPDEAIAVIKEKQVPPETVSIVLEILSIVERNRRKNSRKRQTEGIKTARARGIRFGRPARDIPENFSMLVREWERGNLDLQKVLELSGFTEPTFYRRLREYRCMTQVLELLSSAISKTPPKI